MFMKMKRLNVLHPECSDSESLRLINIAVETEQQQKIRGLGIKNEGKNITMASIG